MEFVSNVCKIQRTAKLCSQQLQTKFMSALQFAAKASVYRNEEALIDLSVAQSLILSVLYSLHQGDLAFCLPLIEICDSLVHLKSSYYRVWLRDDFDFEEIDVIQIFLKLTEMKNTGLLQLPQYISSSLLVLVEKYKLSDHDEICENSKVKRLVSELYSSKEDAQPEENIQHCLRKAIVANDPETISDLVGAGANIDDELDNGDTLLHLAVSNSNLEAVNSLLSFGAMPNWRNRDYITPLQMAVGLNNDLIVEALAKSGALVNQQCAKGNTLLHEAASKGNTEVLKVLVRSGAAINAQNISGQTPLHLATKRNHLKTVDTLVEHGANVNIFANNGAAPIHIALSEGHSKILKRLIESGADLSVKNRSGLTVLHVATNRHIVKLLTHGGVDVNIISDDGDTPLHNAALNGCIEIAKALIASNAEIDRLNSKKATALAVAVKAEHCSMAQLLVASGANVNFKDKEDFGNSLLHWAVQEGKLKCLKFLLDAGADVNILNILNNTALHYAASIGDMTSTELLLDKGAKVNIRNNKGNTPYRFAALNGHLQVAQLLLDKGAKTSTIKVHEESDALREPIRFGESLAGQTPNQPPANTTPPQQKSVEVLRRIHQRKEARRHAQEARGERGPVLAANPLPATFGAFGVAQSVNNISTTPLSFSTSSRFPALGTHTSFPIFR